MLAKNKVRLSVMLGHMLHASLRRRLVIDAGSFAMAVTAAS